MNNRSDIHFWKTGRIGPLIVESDCILGHEASGVVLKLGEGVKDLVVGKCLSFFRRCLLMSVVASILLRGAIYLSLNEGKS